MSNPITNKFTAEADAILRAHSVSSKLGFLISPAEVLPEAYDAWEQLAHSLTPLLAVGVLRDAVDKLPLINASPLLQDEALLARAKLLLATITQAYVFGDSPVRTALPPQLAVPLFQVSDALEIPPIMSYSDYVLANWQLIDPDRPVGLENLKVRIGINGSTDEAWFMLVHVAVEAAAGEILQLCVEARLAADAGDLPELSGLLARLTNSVQGLQDTFLRVRERCDPSVYYLRVRPFTHGWYKNPAFEGGMVYLGVEALGENPVAFRGETGAQSSIVPSLDALLGIRHPDNALQEHLIAMRDYMPRQHRQLRTWLDQSRVRELACNAQSAKCPELLNHYNRSCAALAEFRNVHLQIAKDYVFAHSGSHMDSKANPANLGTGGTPNEYLQHHRDSTRSAVIDG